MRRLLVIGLWLLFTLPLSAQSYYLDGANTVSAGGGTWGAILTLTSSISGQNATFTVSKTDGTAFTSSGILYLKVGSKEDYGHNRDQQTVSAGASSITFSVNLNQHTGYPKQYYARFESDVGGYAWAGPIHIHRVHGSFTVTSQQNNQINFNYTAEHSAGMQRVQLRATQGSRVKTESLYYHPNPRFQARTKSGSETMDLSGFSTGTITLELQITRGDGTTTTVASSGYSYQVDAPLLEVPYGASFSFSQDTLAPQTWTLNTTVHNNGTKDVTSTTLALYAINPANEIITLRDIALGQIPVGGQRSIYIQEDFFREGDWTFIAEERNTNTNRNLGARSESNRILIETIKTPDLVTPDDQIVTLDIIKVSVPCRPEFNKEFSILVELENKGNADFHDHILVDFYGEIFESNNGEHIPSGATKEVEINLLADALNHPDLYTRGDTLAPREFSLFIGYVENSNIKFLTEGNSITINPPLFPTNNCVECSEDTPNGARYSEIIPDEISSPLAHFALYTSIDKWACGATNQNLRLNSWDFWQHSTKYHKVSGGLASADDSYAWDIHSKDDIEANENTAVHAIEDGTIVISKEIAFDQWTRFTEPSSKYEGKNEAELWGAILIQHGSKESPWYSGYMHMAINPTLLSIIKEARTKLDEGEVFREIRIKKGQELGRVSNLIKDGTVSYHLHFAVYERDATTRRLKSYDVEAIEVKPWGAQNTNLRANAHYPDRVSLSWQDQATDELGYRLERRQATEGYTLLNEAPANTEAYLDATTQGGQHYTYRVSTILTDSSTVSNEVEVETPVEGSPALAVSEVSRTQNVLGNLIYNQNRPTVWAEAFWGRIAVGMPSGVYTFDYSLPVRSLGQPSTFSGKSIRHITGGPNYLGTDHTYAGDHGGAFYQYKGTPYSFSQDVSLYSSHSFLRMGHVYSPSNLVGFDAYGNVWRLKEAHLLGGATANWDRIATGFGSSNDENSGGALVNDLRRVFMGRDRELLSLEFQPDHSVAIRSRFKNLDGVVADMAYQGSDDMLFVLMYDGRLLLFDYSTTGYLTPRDTFETGLTHGVALDIQDHGGGRVLLAGGEKPNQFGLTAFSVDTDSVYEIPLGIPTDFGQEIEVHGLAQGAANETRSNVFVVDNTDMVGFKLSAVPLHEIVAPTDGALGVSLTPTLDWTHVTNGPTYTVTLWEAGAYAANPDTAHVYSVSGLTLSEFTLPERVLDDSTFYYWEVTQITSTGTVISVGSSFLTESSPITPNIGSPFTIACPGTAFTLYNESTGPYDSVRWYLPGATVQEVTGDTTNPTYAQLGSYDVALLLDGDTTWYQGYFTVEHLSAQVVYTADSCQAGVSMQNGVAPFTYTWPHDPTLSDSLLVGGEVGTAYTVYIADAVGCTDTAMVTPLKAFPSAAFLIQAQENSVWQFVAQYPTDQHAWELGDGKSGSGNSITNHYSQSGLYTITHSATNACGTDTRSESVRVFDFWGNKTETCPNDSIQLFHDASDSIAVEWTVSGPEDFSSNDTSPVFTFPIEGTYNVTLSVEGQELTKGEYIVIQAIAGHLAFTSPDSCSIWVELQVGAIRETIWSSPAHTYHDDTLIGYVDSVYDVAVTDENGCAWESSVIPAEGIRSADFTATWVQEGQIMLMGVDSLGEHSWTFPDTTISGTWKPTYVFNSSPLSIFHTLLNCGVSTTVSKEIDVAVVSGLDVAWDKAGLHLFPNPFQHQLTLNTGGNNIAQGWLVSTNGREHPIQIVLKTENQWVISTEGVPTGWYVLVIELEDGQRVGQQIIKE